MTSNTMRKPQSLGAFLEIRAHLLGAAFMRGESRRCKGSIEPLLKLPDGALATRRIVLVRCGAAAQSCVPCAARAANRGRCAARNGVSPQQGCVDGLTVGVWRGLRIATRQGDAEMKFDRHHSPVTTAIDDKLNYVFDGLLASV